MSSSERLPTDRAFAFKRREIAATYNARARDRAVRDPKAQLLARLRCSHLERFFHRAYGEEWPDDDAARDDLFVLLHHLQWRGENHVGLWHRIGKTCPWMGEKEARKLIKKVQSRARKWSALALGRKIGLTNSIRTELKITTILPIDVTATELSKRSKDRKAIQRRDARRKNGAKPRSEWEENSIARRKPWITLGVSRATWYRMRKINPSDETNVVPTMLSLSPERGQTHLTKLISGRSGARLRRTGLRVARPRPHISYLKFQECLGPVRSK